MYNIDVYQELCRRKGMHNYRKENNIMKNVLKRQENTHCFCYFVYWSEQQQYRAQLHNIRFGEDHSSYISLCGQTP